MEKFLLVLIIVLAVIWVAAYALSIAPPGPWMAAKKLGVKVRFVRLLRLRLWGIDPTRVLFPLVKAAQAGLPLTLDQLEAHLLAGGHVDRVVDALVAAKQAGVKMGFTQCCTMDLAGQDVLQEVKALANPQSL